MAHISLFENQTDFTPVQVSFLQWLEVYHSLEVDLATKEPYISREVIEDDIRCDAYLTWRESKSNKTEKETTESKEADAAVSNIPSIVFG